MANFRINKNTNSQSPLYSLQKEPQLDSIDSVLSRVFDECRIDFLPTATQYGSLTKPKLYNGGSGLPITTQVTFPDPTIGNNTAEAYPSLGLTTASISMSSPGSNNNIGDIYSVSSSVCSCPASVKITEVDEIGQVTGYKVLFPGYGFDNSPVTSSYVGDPLNFLSSDIVPASFSFVPNEFTIVDIIVTNPGSGYKVRNLSGSNESYFLTINSESQFLAKSIVGPLVQTYVDKTKQKPKQSNYTNFKKLVKNNRLPCVVTQDIQLLENFDYSYSTSSSSGSQSTSSSSDCTTATSDPKEATIYAASGSALGLSILTAEILRRSILAGSIGDDFKAQGPTLAVAQYSKMVDDFVKIKANLEKEAVAEALSEFQRLGIDKNSPQGKQIIDDLNIKYRAKFNQAKAAYLSNLMENRLSKYAQAFDVTTDMINFVVDALDGAKRIPTDPAARSAYIEKAKAYLAEIRKFFNEEIIKVKFYDNPADLLDSGFFDEAAESEKFKEFRRKMNKYLEELTKGRFKVTPLPLGELSQATACSKIKLPATLSNKKLQLVGFVLLAFSASQSEAASTVLQFIPPMPFDIYLEAVSGSELGYGDENQKLFDIMEANAIIADYIYGKITEENLETYLYNGAFANYPFASVFNISQELASDPEYIKDRLNILREQASSEEARRKFDEYIYKKQLKFTIREYVDTVSDDSSIPETDCNSDEFSLDFTYDYTEEDDTTEEDCVLCEGEDNSNDNPNIAQPNVPIKITIPEELLLEIEKFLNENDPVSDPLPPYADKPCKEPPPRTECPLPVWATKLIDDPASVTLDCVCVDSANVYQESLPYSDNYIDTGISVNIQSTSIGLVPHCDCPNNLMLFRLEDSEGVGCKCPTNTVYNPSTGRCDCSDLDGKSAQQRCLDAGFDTVSSVDVSEYSDTRKISGCECECTDYKFYNRNIPDCVCLPAYIKIGNTISAIPVTVFEDVQKLCQCPEGTVFLEDHPNGNMICLQQ